MPTPASKPTPPQPVNMADPSQPKIDWAMLAQMAVQTGMLNTVPTNPVPQRPDFSVRTTPADGIAPGQTWGQWGINQGARIGGGVLGGVAGTLGGPIGALAGIATGAAIGDDWAQGQEVQQGVRDQRNPLETLVAGLTAPIPGGTIARATRLLPAVGKALLTAQPANAVGSVAMQIAEGNGVSLGRTAKDMGASTTMGTGIGLGLRGVQRAPMAATRVAQAPATQHLLASETGAIGPLKGDTGAAGSETRATLSPKARAVIQARAAAGYVDAEEALRWADTPVEAAAIEASRDPSPARYTERANRADRVRDYIRKYELLANEAPPAVGDPAPVTVGPPKATRVKGVRHARPAGPDANTPVGETFVPAKPLDPTNLPAVVQPRQPLQPAQVAEDIERTYRRNTEFLGMDETTARTLAERSATPEAQVQKRRVMSVPEMQARSNQIEATLPKPGTALNAEQQLALADHVAGLSDTLETLRERIGNVDALKAGVLRGDPDAQATITSLSQELGVSGIEGIEAAQLKAFSDLASFQLADEAVGSEWGRAGRARQVLAKARQLPDVEFLKQAYEMGLPKPEAIEALGKLRGDPSAQKQFLSDLYKPSGQEYWKAFLANNMLSGVPTLGVNLQSNLTNLVRKEAARYQVAGIERASGVTDRAVAIPPAKLLAQSYADGMRHAGKAMLSAMWEGHTPLDDTIAVNVGETFKGHWLAAAMARSGVEQDIANKFGRLAANKWKRILVGTDAAFQMMAIYPESYRRATAEALNKGLKGQDLVDAIQARVRGFDYHADASAAVRDYAKGVTFAGDFGPISGAFQRVVRAIDGGTVKVADKMYAARTGKTVGKDFKSGSQYGLVQFPVGFAHFPFVRIGATLWNQTVGLLTDGAKGSFNLATKQGDRTESLQRMVESANAYMLMGTVAALYGAGSIDFTTRAPENAFEREQFYNVEGKQPWSIGIGGRYIPLASFGPLGSALGPVAAYLKGVDKDDDKTRAERFAAATAAVAKMHLDGTLVRTAMSVFEGLTDEDKQGRLAGNYIAQLTPEGAFLRNVRDVTDGTLRDPKTLADEAKAQLPILAETVAPRLNAWGGDIQRQHVAKRVIGSAPMSEDYIGQELIALKESLPDLGRMDEGVYPGDLKVAASAFEKSMEHKMNEGVTKTEDGVKVRLTDDERQQYMRLVGTATKEALATMIDPTNAEWTALTPEEKRALVKELKSLGKEIGEELFLEQWLGTDQ